MRKLEDRLAEINRRSDRIIKRRKKLRKWALVTCAPVILSVFVVAAVMPEQAPTESCAPAETGVYAAGGYGIADGDMAETVIEVTGPNLKMTHSAVAPVSKILETIEHLLPSNSNGEEKLQEKSAAGGAVYGSEVDGGVGYTILIHGADGKTRTLFLQNGKLVDCDTGAVCALSEMKLQILETVLGIHAAEE